MTNQQINFLNMIAPIAVRQASKHNGQLFASVTIAQAAHESGWGSSTKMVNANALFGVKVGKSAYKFGTAWKGAAYKTGTTEYYDGVNPTKITDYFRAYDSIEDATEDYMDMLCHCSRYKNSLNRSTPEESIRAIVAGGYATGPQYANSIISIISSCNLKIFDSGQTPVIPSQSDSQYVTGQTYTINSDLYIRQSAAGSKKKFEKITENAKENAFSDEDGYAILKNGTRVTCKGTTKKNGQIWMKIPSGYIIAKKASGQIYIE